jgi:hypothetical protein
VIAAVDVVSHEDVGGVWNLATLVEELKQVVELAVDVAANSSGRAYGLHVAFLNEDLFDFLAQ